MSFFKCTTCSFVTEYYWASSQRFRLQFNPFFTKSRRQIPRIKKGFEKISSSCLFASLNFALCGTLSPLSLFFIKKNSVYLKLSYSKFNNCFVNGQGLSGKSDIEVSVVRDCWAGMLGRVANVWANAHPMKSDGMHLSCKTIEKCARKRLKCGGTVCVQAKKTRRTHQIHALSWCGSHTLCDDNRMPLVLN